MKKYYILFLILCVSISACRKTSVDGMPDVENPSAAYLCDGDIEDTPAYQLYLSQYSSVESEVTYLINLARYSPYRFCRNNTVYSGEDGAKWLEYKMTLFGEEVMVARDFATKIANSSRRSGKPYYIIYPDDTKCLMEIICLNELRRLHAKEAEKDDEAAAQIEAEMKAEEAKKVLEAAPVAEVPAAIESKEAEETQADMEIEVDIPAK